MSKIILCMWDNEWVLWPSNADARRWGKNPAENAQKENHRPSTWNGKLFPLWKLGNGNGNSKPHPEARASNRISYLHSLKERSTQISNTNQNSWIDVLTFIFLKNSSLVMLIFPSLSMSLNKSIIRYPASDTYFLSLVMGSRLKAAIGSTSVIDIHFPFLTTPPCTIFMFWTRTDSDFSTSSSNSKVMGMFYR